MEDMSSSRYPMVELDFFGLEHKQNTSPSSSSTSKSQFQKLLEQQRTVRGMQSAISKLNPQLLKNVISSGAASTTSNLDTGKSLPAFIKHEPVLFRPSGGGGGGGGGGGDLLTPKQNHHHHHQNNYVASTLPILVNHNNIPMLNTPPPHTSTAPLTIFYNGTVSVFDVPRDKAEILMKLAENGMSSNNVVESITDTKVPMYSSSSMDQDKLLETLNGDDLPIARKKSLQRFLAKRKERSTTSSIGQVLPNELSPPTGTLEFIPRDQYIDYCMPV